MTLQYDQLQSNLSDAKSTTLLYEMQYDGTHVVWEEGNSTVVGVGDTENEAYRDYFDQLEGE